MEKFNSILLIDDDPTSNFLGQQLIQRLNLANKVYCAYNGRHALQLLQGTNLQPDIIFLDLNMPLMNGYEFLTAFHETHHAASQANIVILTSSEDGGDLDKVQTFGIRYYLCKPLIEHNLLKICEIIQLNIKLKFVMLAS
jgi:CheY-like chemotaxis protein